LIFKFDFSPACQNGHLECLQMLLDVGADINCLDLQSESPLWKVKNKKTKQRNK